MEVQIIFQDQNLMVVNKPVGMTTTNEGRKQEVSLENWLDQQKMGEGLLRRGIVHRLDKDTSGLVLIAKNTDVLDKLKIMFKSRNVLKKYLALAGGDLPEKGIEKMPIGRSRYAFGKYAVNEEGKEAWTEFEVIKKYRFNGRIYSLVEIGLKTGRTHQIRVHFSYLRWPLVGDKTYGGEMILGLKHQFLQACKLKFEHPITKQEMSFSVELNQELNSVLEAMESV